jgi:hypothetical protein
MDKRHLSRDERFTHLNSYLKSPLSVKKYATLNGIGYSTFQKWLCDYKKSLKSKKKDHVSSNSACAGMTTTKLFASQQQDSSSNSTVHFVDITPRVASSFVQADSLKKVCDETHNFASVPPVSPNPYYKNPPPSSSSLGSIDLFLPNGLRMTFHQTSVATSVELIHALTLAGNHASFSS